MPIENKHSRILRMPRAGIRFISQTDLAEFELLLLNNEATTCLKDRPNYGGDPPNFGVVNSECYPALCLLLIDSDYVGKKLDHVRRMRARVIGTGGKTRRVIEELSEAELSIYGDTVAIIGDSMALDIAKTAVDMILNGSEHSAVYSYLEHTRRERRLSELKPPEDKEKPKEEE